MDRSLCRIALIGVTACVLNTVGCGPTLVPPPLLGSPPPTPTAQQSAGGTVTTTSSSLPGAASGAGGGLTVTVRSVPGSVVATDVVVPVYAALSAPRASGVVVAEAHFDIVLGGANNPRWSGFDIKLPSELEAREFRRGPLEPFATDSSPNGRGLRVSIDIVFAKPFVEGRLLDLVVSCPLEGNGDLTFTPIPAADPARTARGPAITGVPGKLMGTR